ESQPKHQTPECTKEHELLSPLEERSTLFFILRLLEDVETSCPEHFIHGILGAIDVHAELELQTLVGKLSRRGSFGDDLARNRSERVATHLLGFLCHDDGAEKLGARLSVARKVYEIGS